MKEFYRNFFLNLNEEETSNQDNYDSIIQILEKIQSRPKTTDNLDSDANMDFRFDQNILEYDNHENPFLANKRNFRLGDLNRLFVGSDDSLYTTSSSIFNTDTQLEFLGSLRIWQVAAIMIAFVMFLALAIFLFRKLNKIFTKYTPPALVASSSLENLRGCSVRSTYSTDSTNHLLAKSFSIKPNESYTNNDFGNIKKKPLNFV
ncbi:unnamed protein product [Brachionus calyciflorus]|uniref:Uncharacterized protein n=1 Tax=Brachionus calyciflorus TaxID=104777 RepID=A0A813SAA8_9BILA|nr:unnamed protein product [Brachionus calyciflorus]